MTGVSSKTMLTLLLATAALAGAQALAPGLASATVQLGEECADPTYPSADCEPTGGGGGGSQGGGTSDGSNAGEVIEVHDTPPSPCVVNPSVCLPRETGGRPRGVQADRGPYQPRHGGRPARVAEGDSPASRCRAENRLADAAEKRLRWFEQAQKLLVGKWRALDYDVYAVDKRVAGLRAARDFLRGDPSVHDSDLLLAGTEAELAALERDLDSLKAARDEVARNGALDRYLSLRRDWAQALDAAATCAKR